ncbi:MAG: ABC transporter ATP-binding protein [Bacilli bacterium]|nr:ABC transporter ATP-binding protein [Bacilli bacterium]
MRKLFKYFKSYIKETILAPLFKLLEALLELFIPLVVASIIDNGIGLSDKSYVIKMIIVMISCGIVGLILSVLGQYFAARTAVGFSTKLRYDLFKKIEGLSFSDIDNLGTSSIITRMTSDVNQVQTGINLTLRLFLRSPFVVFGAAIMAYLIDPSISSIFFISIFVLSVVVFGIMLLTMPLHRRVQENLDGVLSQTKENLSGVRVIRAFTSETEEIEKYSTSIKKLERSQNKVGNISNLLNPLTFIIVNTAIIILIYAGALKVDSGMLTQGEVIALYNYMSQILVELIKLASLIITMTKSVSCGKRISKIIEMDTTCFIDKDNNTISDKYISYQNVSMKYKSSSQESLENISFDVEKGETIGIIGGTGSGKSSLISLLLRFYDVSNGCVYFNHLPIESYHPKELRDKISIVLQKSVLFKGTIRDNIRWGKKDATDEEIIKALEIAQGLDILSKKDEGLNSFVSQGGKNFSGGQRQRLALARAIVKRPEVLILDDSASALDFATDAALRKAIKNLDYNPTVFIVSQRTASIQNADKILVLDDGCLVGMGTHEELLSSNAVYQEIYYSQFKKEDNKDE